jgi:hypothetical protein
MMQRRSQRLVAFWAIAVLSACAKSGQLGRNEQLAAFTRTLYPEAARGSFHCTAPVEIEHAPYLDCRVDMGHAPVLMLHAEYRGEKNPYMAVYYGELANTQRLIALNDPTGTAFGPQAAARVRARIHDVQPVIERLVGRALGTPDLAMRRAEFHSAPAGVVVWRATYFTKVQSPRIPDGRLPIAFIDLEPIGGNVIRVELN